MALMPVADALAAILAGAEPLPEEMVALDAAYHRTLARDVAARRTQPPQAMSAMDGYAVRAADAADLSARLKVIGEVAAGRPFERSVGAGEAVRIFTGGVIPDGADAVIIQEDTAVDGDHITDHRGRRRRAGTSAPPASTSARATCCSPAAATSPTAICSLAAAHELSGACGAPPPEGRGARHRRRAGDAGSQPGPGQIVYSNGYALRALARAEGAETVDLGIAADTVERHRRTASAGRARPDADILITTRRRLGRRPRPRSSSRWRPRASRWRSGGSRCGRASR